ncbi:MAG: glycosyltransferase family 39 protein [Candidatus Eremiobacteraeota bacterium]|nr:glycosyltransferase family 39 protein [Candidatus Eremiobacteraeota bacterium]
MRRLPVYLGIAAFIFHALGNPHYGFFRDELYFIICGRHPAWGYVDQPPIVPILAALSQTLGQSLFALRLLPALAAGLTTFFAVEIARLLAGNRFAQVLTGITVSLIPIIVGITAIWNTTALQPLGWTMIVWSLIRMQQGRDPRWWIAIGVVVGITMMSKYDIVFFVLAVGTGLALTKERRLFATCYVVLGAAIAIAIILPNVIWQATHHWAMIQLLVAGSGGKNVLLAPLAYMGQQILVVNPLYALIWIPGLIYAYHTPYRWITLTYLVLTTLMIVFKAKIYYQAAIYPAVFAFGCIAIAQVIRGHRALAVTLVVAAAFFGLLPVPSAMPVLAESTFVAYARALHIAVPVTEHHRMGALPQGFADMHGWPEMARTVNRVFQTLTPAERVHAVIFAGNYGEAAAVEFFNPDRALPVISGHNQYFLWGPKHYDGSVLIDIGGTVKDDLRVCRAASLAATFSNPLGMPYEDNLGIVICRHLKTPVPIFFARQKHFE